MKYKRGQRFGLPYERQSYLYFYCQNYAELKENEQERVRELCARAGEQYGVAVFEAVTSDRRLLEVALENYMSERHLQRKVAAFYIDLDKEVSGRTHKSDKIQL